VEGEPRSAVEEVEGPDVDESDVVNWIVCVRRTRTCERTQTSDGGHCCLPISLISLDGAMIVLHVPVYVLE